MKIIFSYNSNKIFKIIKNSETTGIILGNVIGDHVLIENLFPINYETIISNYENIYYQFNNNFLGIFLFNKELQIDEIFLGDFILINQNGRLSLKKIDLNNNKITLTGI